MCRELCWLYQLKEELTPSMLQSCRTVPWQKSGRAGLRLGYCPSKWTCCCLLLNTMKESPVLKKIQLFNHLFFLLIFQEWASLCIPGCPGTYRRSDWPRTQGSVCLCLLSQHSELKTCPTTPWLQLLILIS